MKKYCILIVLLSILIIFFISCKKDETYSTPIVANAGSFKTLQLPLDSTTLTGTVSSGQNSSLIYSWTMIAGPNTSIINNGNSATAEVTNLMAGTYIFQFEVQNSIGTAIAIDTTSIIVLGAPVQVLTNTQLLTQHVWEDERAVIQIGNTQTYYIRDSINTTLDNLDAERWTYYANGTGSDFDGTNTWTFTWTFIDSAQTQMNVVVNYSTGAMAFTFAYIQLSSTEYTYTEYYMQNGTEVLSTIEHIPVP